ncbi:MAG: dTMP kinase [Desulfofustis sp.]|nr:dTMP kinase [Desulfofustis sp.]
MNQVSGRLIVFEGIDGTGKSTQLSLLQHHLEDRGYSVVATREPTDGVYGQKIRALYRSRDTVSREEELALFIADRRDHVAAVLAPALAGGQIVLCDRYFLSTAAYQGAAGLDPDRIIARNAFAPTPDLALLFELDPREALRRITEHRGDQPNDFEQLDYLQKVDTVFRRMRLPYIKRIDAGPSADLIQQMVRKLVDELLDHHQT